MRLDFWGMIRFGIGALTSKDGQGDKIGGTPGPVGSRKGQETVARYYPWGFDSRSPRGGARLCVAPNGGSNLAQIGERNDKAPPDYDDENWTTILHNEVAGTWVKLRKDGGVQVAGKNSVLELKADGTAKITSGSGATIEMKAGGIISLNGGVEHVIRAGDFVLPSAPLIGWMTSVSAAAMVPSFPTGSAIGYTDGGALKVNA